MPLVLSSFSFEDRLGSGIFWLLPDNIGKTQFQASQGCRGRQTEAWVGGRDGAASGILAQACIGPQPTDPTWELCLSSLDNVLRTQHENDLRSLLCSYVKWKSCLLLVLSQHHLFFFFLHPLLLFGFFLGQVGKATVRSQTQSSFLTHAHACQELASLLIS